MFDRFRIGYQSRGRRNAGHRRPGGRALGFGSCRTAWSNGGSATAARKSRSTTVSGVACLRARAAKAAPMWTRRFEWSGEGELRRMGDSAIGEIRHEYDAAHRLRRRILPGGRVKSTSSIAPTICFDSPGSRACRCGTATGSLPLPALPSNTTTGIMSRWWIRRRGVPATVPQSRPAGRRRTPRGRWTARYDALGRRTRKIWAGH